MVLAVLTILDLSLYFVGIFLNGDHHRTVFIQYLSVTLAIAAPILLGRAMRLRFNTNSVWILAACYASLQPIAYGITFGMPGNQYVGVVLDQPVSIPSKLNGILKSSRVVESNAQYSPVDAGDSDSIDSVKSAEVILSEGEYRVALSWEDGRPARKELDALLVALDDQVDWVEMLVVRAKVHFEDIVFSLLAILKLIWSATVLAAFRDSPVDYASTITSYRRPPKENQLVPSLKVFYWGQVAAAIAVLMFVTWYMGFVIIIPVIVYSVIWGLPMYAGKGGKSWSTLLESIAKAFGGK